MNTEQNQTLELAKKAKRGDKQAFGDLIKLHKEYFYRTAFIYAKKEESALEVFQEAVVRALLGIGKLKDPEYFKTWMTRIIYNCAMEMYRSSARTVSMDEDPASEAVDTARSDLSKEERMDLHNAIQQLPESYQSVIVQKYFDGMKISEIAENSGKPEGTIKSDLSRAKRQLRDILREGYRYV